jgi:hypothetical protein
MVPMAPLQETSDITYFLNKSFIFFFPLFTQLTSLDHNQLSTGSEMEDLGYHTAEGVVIHECTYTVQSSLGENCRNFEKTYFSTTSSTSKLI